MQGLWPFLKNKNCPLKCDIPKYIPLFITQSCPTLCNPVDYTRLLITEILQARPAGARWPSLGDPPLKNQTQVSCCIAAGNFFYHLKPPRKSITSI